MKKFLGWCVFIVAFLHGSAQQNTNWFSVKAFLPGWNKAVVSLFIDENPVFTDSLRNDIFSYTGTIDKPSQGLLVIRLARKIYSLPVFIEPGTIKIRDAGSKSLAVYGTISNDTYFIVTRRLDSMALLAGIPAFSDAINHKRKLASEFIFQHSNSVVSLQLLRDYYYLQPEANDTVYYSLFHSLNEHLRQTQLGRKISEEAEVRYQTAIGRRAPNPVLKDTLNTAAVVFEEGVITLVDFWASWCVPCRKENPALVKLYNKYKTQSFKIVSISLDTNKMLWLQAIKKDRLAWKQLSDLKGWQSRVVHTFGIKVVPTNYLLDKNGIIIAKNITIEELDKLLPEVIAKQSDSMPQLFTN